MTDATEHRVVILRFADGREVRIEDGARIPANLLSPDNPNVWVYGSKEEGDA